MRLLLLLILFSLPAQALPAITEEHGTIFGSMRKNEVNVRSGPGTQFPILWIYKRFGYPVEIINTYQSWYQIRDIEGESGWIYKGMLSKRRTSLVSDGTPLVMYKNADATEGLIRIAPHVILAIDHCTPHLCKVVYGNTSGWALKKRLILGVD
ncbi:MAG: SH3-like domain-containing protein [Alphaproteobacteria bacterium]|jgi:SH3-like domain-containing protein